MRPRVPFFAALLLTSTLAPVPPPANTISPEPVNVDQDTTCRPLTERTCINDAFCRWNYRADVCVRR
jgi:hypothetical protein